jgi:predicted O-methyltransferase YrrM
MKMFENLGRLLRSPLQATQHLAQIVQGTANQSRLLNDKLEEIIAALDNQQHNLNVKLSAIIEYQSGQLALQRAQAEMTGELLKAVTGGSGKMVDLGTIQVRPADFQRPPARELKPDSPPAAGESKSTFLEAMQRIPLLLDEKTYNTSHHDYDATAVRNEPGRIFNADKPCHNGTYAELRKLARGDAVPDKTWDKVLRDMLEEAKGVPHAQQVFERRTFIEQYTAEIHRKYQSHYAPDGVNLDDALFLYWLVRSQKPKTIVQTRVCNGLSSAFMMLALAKNGPEGRLRVVDLAPVFDPTDSAWTVKDKAYGVVIPEGKSSGWMVPDAYRDRFEVWNGDAKVLLPKLVDKVDAIDMFYHDSDHTYNHMMFEFRQAKRKLRPGGLIVGDDISWNASVWDFADEFGVPSYNFKGAVGVAFF